MASKPPTQTLFDLPPTFFDSSHLLSGPVLLQGKDPNPVALVDDDDESSRWTCHTCKAEFESLLHQRSHFKSDLHRLNVKLTLVGKSTIKEEDFDHLYATNSPFEDFDVSSISGSEDELDNEHVPHTAISVKEKASSKQKLYIQLQSGEIVSLWRCLILKENEAFSLEETSTNTNDELINKFKFLIHEPRDGTHLRIVLLVSGGHFAGCVFDGNSVLAHKTFHRYVVRAKAGKKQSANDATGRAASSAGSSLRRYNEAALKKEIQELLVSWKSYFASSTCIWVHASSKNQQLFFDGEDTFLAHRRSIVRNIPLTVRRPTLKEAKRVYNLLTRISYGVAEEASLLSTEPPVPVDKRSDSKTPEGATSSMSAEAMKHSSRVCPDLDLNEAVVAQMAEVAVSSIDTPKETPLHEAAKCGDVHQILELLEQGSDPCIKDYRGWTPYMVAKDKEVRNIFRRFMALNLDKWDWHAANVPSALTKEMEESQATKQAEKDAKRKAKMKELKRLRKAKEKAQAEAAIVPSAASTSKVSDLTRVTTAKGQSQRNRIPTLSKEEQQKRELEDAREKRAAAAERRMSALNAASQSQETSPSVSQPKTQTGANSNDSICSCCNSSLAGKVPFHRYHYKYCSTTCMHVHREMLEDE